jgi:hypothetical protein
MAKSGKSTGFQKGQGTGQVLPGHNKGGGPKKSGKK